MHDIYKAVCASAPWSVTCVRRAKTVTIYSELLTYILITKQFDNFVSATYPYRPVQIVLRLYQSPAEILANFDVDSSCLAYDGKWFPSDPSLQA